LMQGYLGRTMRLARQLGARRFEAQGLEMQCLTPADVRKLPKCCKRRWRSAEKQERSSAGQRRPTESSDQRCLDGR
jgi:hypothetical protein